MNRMSDDLISREDLLGTQRLLMTDIVENNPTAKFVLEQVLFDIEHAETAFDKEKVIEELKSNMGSAQLAQLLAGTDLVQCGGFSYGYYNGMKDAIEIFEKGGIE